MDELDIYQREQQLYDEAAARTDESDEYKKLAKEYGRLLKQIRRTTKIADKTAFDLNENNEDLTDKVHIDAMTGIYNRRYIDETLTHNIKTASRMGGDISVLVLDVDFFKKYNDTYGHSQGDECLKLLAGALKDSLSRAADFAARYGGEEFVIVLPNTGESGARLIADKVLDNVRALNIPHEKNDAAPYVTMSIGVTTAKAVHTQTCDDYIKRADKALYQSKNSGRNRYTYISFEGGD